MENIEDQAEELATRRGWISISLVQRTFRLSYKCACSIIDALQLKEVVGQADATGMHRLTLPVMNHKITAIQADHALAISTRSCSMQENSSIQTKLNDLYEQFKRAVSLPAELARRAAPPLLLNVPEKWAGSDRRVLIVGQETLGWDFEPGDYFPALTESIRTFDDFLRIPNSVAALAAGYRDFVFAAKQPDNYKSPFWRAYRSIRAAVGEAVDGPETAVLWTNLFRMALDNGSVYQNGSVEEAVLMREAGSDLLRAEIQALAPTAVIFFTGPNYNEHLYAQFPGIEVLSFEGHQPEKTGMLRHPLLPAKTFRTYHPGYLSRSGQWGVISEMAGLL